MNFISCFLLLLVSSISAASITDEAENIYANGKNPVNIEFDIEGIDFPDKYHSVSCHDNVFRFLRNGLSVPRTLRSDAPEYVPSNFYSPKPENQDDNILQQPTDVLVDLKPFLDHTFSNSSLDLNLGSSECLIAPTISPVAYTAPITIINSPIGYYNFAPSPFIVQPLSSLVQSPVFDNRRNNKCFSISQGTPSKIGRTISFIPEIKFFMDTIIKKHLSLSKSSYVLIPVANTNPSEVERLASGSVAIRAKFSTTNLSKNLKFLNQTLTDENIFDSIRTIVIQFNNDHKATLTFLFNDKINDHAVFILNAFRPFYDYSFNVSPKYFIWE